MSYFLSAKDSFLEKKAHGWRLKEALFHLDNTAPIPVAEASTPTTNGSSGSGC